MASNYAPLTKTEKDTIQCGHDFSMGIGEGDRYLEVLEQIQHKSIEVSSSSSKEPLKIE